MNYVTILSCCRGISSNMYMSDTKKTQRFVPFLCQYVQFGDHRIVQLKPISELYTII
jgi:hypothetical protein